MYAERLTKDYLEYLGITNVSEDGTKIMKGDKEVTQHYDGHYKLCTLYDPLVRQAIPPAQRNNASGNVILGVHRIVYVWYNGIQHSGYVIDHIDGNKVNNRLENLQQLTPAQNLSKSRGESTKQTKCKLNKPREYYETKLNRYLEAYESAKVNKQPELCHKLRANIANTRARLRYYDSHIDEVNEIKESIKMTTEEKIAKQADKKDLEILQYWKKVFREAGNKGMWRECIRVEKLWKDGKLDKLAKKHCIDVLLGLGAKK